MVLTVTDSGSFRLCGGRSQARAPDVCDTAAAHASRHARRGDAIASDRRGGRHGGVGRALAGRPLRGVLTGFTKAGTADRRRGTRQRRWGAGEGVSMRASLMCADAQIRVHVRLSDPLPPALACARPSTQRCGWCAPRCAFCRSARARTTSPRSRMQREPSPCPAGRRRGPSPPVPLSNIIASVERYPYSFEYSGYFRGGGWGGERGFHELG